MDMEQGLWAVFGLSLAGVIKGATGLGLTSAALPFLVVAVGLEAAVAIVIGPAIASCLSLVWTDRHLRATLRDFARLYAGILPGIAAGIALQTVVGTAAALAVLGICLVLYSSISLARPRLALPARLTAGLQLPTGLANGVITGLTGSQVIPLLPYVLASNLGPDRSVQVVNIAVLIASAALAVGLVLSGGMTPMLLAASLIAIPPALIGVELGVRIRSRIPAALFKSAVLAVLLVMGLAMIARALPEVAARLTFAGATVPLHAASRASGVSAVNSLAVSATGAGLPMR